MLDSFLRSRLVKVALGTALLGALAATAINHRFLVKHAAIARLDPFVRPIPVALSRPDPARTEIGRTDAARTEAARSDAARGDATLFRRLQPLLFNSRRLADFASHTKVPAVLFDIVESGMSQQLRVEYNYGVSRSDFRDLPEALARDYSLQVLKDGIGSGTTVTYLDRFDARALEAGTAFSAYVEDSALRLLLDEHISRWSADASAATVSAQADLLDVRNMLASLDRRISGFSALRDKAKATGSATAANTDPSVQIQMTDSRFLSVPQQLTALETERLEALERQRQLQAHVERLAARQQIIKRMGPLLTPNTPSKAMLTSLAGAFDTEKAAILAAKDADKTNIGLAFTDIDVFMTMLQHRFLQSRVPEVYVKREGPNWFVAASLGAFGSLLLLWFGGLLLHRSGRLDASWWASAAGTKAAHAKASANMP